MNWKVAVFVWLRQVEYEEEACVERIAEILLKNLGGAIGSVNR